MALVLAIAHFGNKYEPSYPRNDNHAPPVFWLVNAILAIGAYMTWTWNASSAGRSGGSPRVIMLGREQTEEWKGWMQVSRCGCCKVLTLPGPNMHSIYSQWAFIFYHYYRVYYVYNEIRVFVSAYVWMVSYFLREIHMFINRSSIHFRVNSIRKSHQNIFHR